jgi:hypothetical protein
VAAEWLLKERRVEAMKESCHFDTQTPKYDGYAGLVKVALPWEANGTGQQIGGSFEDPHL